MNNINKKLYSVIIACLLLLCFSLNALATESSNIATLNSSVPENTITSSGLGDEGTSSGEGNIDGDENISSDLTDVSSGEDGDLSSTDSDLSDDSNLSSGEENVSDESNNESDSSGESSSKPSYQGNVGGYINDEADTSGWGGSDYDSSTLVSAGTTQKKDNKKITNYSGLLWILIWIPILFIIASIGALVFVNRKAFLKQDASFTDANNVYPPKRRKISAAEKAKLKNNHKNRTNVYKPRD